MKTLRALLRSGLLAVLCGAVTLTGCQHERVAPPVPEPEPQADVLSRVLETGTLTIATRTSPTTYYGAAGNPAGYEYELASAFARHLGVDLQVKVAGSVNEIFKLVESGDADLAAAGLTVTDSRSQRFGFSSSYMAASELVIYRSGQQRPREIEDLGNGRLMVMAGSSHAETLRQKQQELPALGWMEAPVGHTLELLERLDNGEIDFTIVDSNVFLASHGMFPRLRVAFELGEAMPFAWATSKTPMSHGLLTVVNDFVAAYQASGRLAELNEQHYGHTPEINSSGLMTFNRYMGRRLPRYEDLIRRIADEEGIDWRLLAAISYQESHWDPDAVSPTGVRGMMMLTQSTATEMGVSNRIDAEQSLHGGARYFKKILARIPARIAEPDRTWLALAAYNVGFGHLEDARVITQRQGGDPDCWADVSLRLPMLRQKQWYKQTRHGYARGQEPVNYVRNIRRYYNIISMSELAESLPQFEVLTVNHVAALADITAAPTYL